MSFGISRGKTLDVGDVGINQHTLPSPEEGRIDPRHWFVEFGYPLHIEIGSGKGTFLIQEGTIHQETNYLGFEWAQEFYRYAADRIRRHHATNIKIMNGDATEFLKHWCVSSVADVIHLYFSDPWPKKRHHKRRVIQDATLTEFHRVLKDGGLVHVVTDHESLWEWDLEHFERNNHLFEMQPFTPVASADEHELVGSNFERKYKKEGRPFYATTLHRIDACTDKE